MNWNIYDIKLAMQRMNKKKDVPERPESTLQKSAESFLKAQNVPFIHLHDAKHNQADIADLVFPGKNGTYTAVELKKKTGKLRSGQLVWLRLVISRGGRAFVVRDIDTFVELYHTGHTWTKEQMKLGLLK